MKASKAKGVRFAWVAAAAVVLSCALSSQASAGVGARLAVDVKPGPSGITSGSDLRDGFFEYRDKLFFTAGFSRYGREYWNTDGRTANLVRDVYPGPESGIPGFDPVVFQGDVYFRGRSPETGDELWRLTDDGEDAELALDLFPGPGSAYPSDFTVFKGELYFAGTDGASGRELWKYDGERAELLGNIDHGPGDSIGGFASRGILGDHLYFLANDGELGTELWRTDGTTAELWLDATPGAEGSYFFNLDAAGPYLFFSTRTDYGINLTAWRSDGVTNEPIGSFEMGGFLRDGDRTFTRIGSSLGVIEPPNYRPRNIFSSDDDGIWSKAIFGDTLYFVVEDYSGDEGGLWKYAAGRFTRIEANAGTAAEPEDAGLSVPVAELGGETFLVGYDRKHGSELWVLRGDGAVRYRDILPGIDGSQPHGFFEFRDKVYFLADDGRHGFEVWELFEDDQVAIRLLGDRFPLRGGRAKVRLRCPSSETAGPCKGTVRLVRSGRTIGKGRFLIGAGRTGTPRIGTGRVRTGPVTAKVTVNDGAGNRKTITRKARIVR